MKKRKTALPPKAAKGGKGGADLGAIFDELQAMMAVDCRHLQLVEGRSG